MLKILDPTTRVTRISGAAFFKHNYLTNPTVMLEDQVITAAACLADTLYGMRSPQLHTSTLQVLGDLRDVFHKAARATNASLLASDTYPRQAAPLPSRNSPPIPDTRDHTLSPTPSPCTPSRVQPILTLDFSKKLFERCAA